VPAISWIFGGAREIRRRYSNGARADPADAQRIGLALVGQRAAAAADADDEARLRNLEADGARGLRMRQRGQRDQEGRRKDNGGSAFHGSKDVRHFDLHAVSG
jgi:hypothetical protein